MMTISAPPPSRHALRVLVVDDEIEIAELLSEMLQLAAYDVTTVHTGEGALALLQQEHFDAIVSDLRMPDLDGIAMWRRLGRDVPALAQRILFVTGDTLGRDAQRFFAESGCPSLDKPFRRSDLLQRIAALVALPSTLH